MNLPVQDKVGAALSGLRVLVTRPEGQSAVLSRLIEQAGGVALRLPVLEIVASRPECYQAAIDDLHQFDCCVFVSANAVRMGHQVRGERFGHWPRHCRVAAIGRQTARVLGELGLSVDVYPERCSNSEGLLALPEMQDMAGTRVLIVRGVGGRELLAETLHARGATVRYAEVYERRMPVDCAPGLRQLAAASSIDVVTITSCQTLQNLYDASVSAGCRDWLLTLMLVVMSPRIIVLARALGFRCSPIQVAEMSDFGFILALKECYSKGK